MVATLALAALAFPQTQSGQRPASTRSTKPVKAWGLTWQPSIESALALAKKKDKPVAWFRVLGELTGGC